MITRWIKNGIVHRFINNKENIESFIIPLYAVDQEVPELSSFTLVAYFKVPYNFFIPNSSTYPVEGVCYEPAPGGDPILIDVRRSTVSIFDSPLVLAAAENSTNSDGVHTLVGESAEGRMMFKDDFITIFVQNDMPSPGCLGLQLKILGIKE